MSEKKRSRRRKDEYTGPGEQKVENPSKDEYAVAKWMKNNVKTKKTKFLNHNVEYFTSSKAIDALLKSKFSEGDKALFATREQAIDFLDIMLEHKFFHRAKKVPITLDELRGNAKVEKGEKTTNSAKKDKEEHGNKKASKTTAATTKELRKDTDNERKDTEAEGETNAEAVESGKDGNTAAGGSVGDKKEKRKRKIRLDMHAEQIFVDGSEAYVWIYDPIPFYYWIFGFIVLLSAVAICLFPLWPPMLRQGVYYLSILAAGFLSFILVLTILRLIVFMIVWALTGGKLHLWIIPNLTEDVGFFASFWPLYESNYVSDTDDNKTTKKSKSKSKKKDKDSDVEENAANEPNNEGETPEINAAVTLEPDRIEQIKEHDADIELRQRTNVPAASIVESQTSITDGISQQHQPVQQQQRSSESDSDGSSKDYEIINSSEVQIVN